MALDPQVSCLQIAGLFGPGWWLGYASNGGTGHTYIGDEMYLVFRDDGAGTFDYTMPCGLYEDGDTTVTIVQQDLDGAEWQYVACGVSPGGTMGEPSSVCVIVVDGAGAMDYQPGNEPTGQTATAIAGGKIRVTWLYNMTDQPAEPTGFKVYQDDGGGFVLAHTEPYVEGRGRYTYTTDALTGGVTYDYYVRTYRTVSGSDYETTNTTAVSATADDAGPAAIDPLTATAW